MNSTDLVTMLGNLSRSFPALQHLITGLGYLIGLLFFYAAFVKLKKMAGSGGHSQERSFVPIAYFLGGAALLFLPSAYTVFSNTAFGVGNILQYTNYNPYNVYSAMGIVIRTAGIIWFVRGCVLLVQASEPGVQHGPKGLAFLCASILAMNFDNTVAFLNYVMGRLQALASAIKG